MKIAEYYHSGLAEEHQAEPCDRFEWGPVLALRHDLFEPLPREFERCDVFYLEPPWRVGFNEFNRRAKVDHNYSRFMERLSEVLRSLRVPVFCVAGDAAVKMLPNPTAKAKIKVHGLGAVLLCYNSAPILPHVEGRKVVTNLECIAALANRFQCVGDLFCGYGLAGRIFLEYGRACVLSDYNAKCIGRIRDTVLSWSKNPVRR